MSTTSGAAIATRTRMTMKIADAIATRSERNRRQNSSSGDRAATSSGTSSTDSTVVSDSTSSSEPETLMTCGIWPLAA